MKANKVEAEPEKLQLQGIRKDPDANLGAVAEEPYKHGVQKLPKPGLERPVSDLR